METTERERLESLISNYQREQVLKKKHILYLNLVDESLKLVKKIVSSMYPMPNTVSREDLIQVGAIGVLNAIDTYKSIDKGSFKTYVTKFVKGKILHYLRDKACIVRPPRETYANISKIKNAISELSAGTSINPTVDELSDYTGISKDKIKEILDAESLKTIVSLDQKIFSDDGVESIIDLLQDEDYKSYEELYENKKLIEFALNKLPLVEKKVIYMYYIEGLNKKSIAQEINMSAMQVSRIIKRALNKMYVIMQDDI